MINKIILFLFCLVTSLSLFAQQIPAEQQELIEALLQDLDSEGDFDFNTIFETLSYYQTSPLNINKATEAELQELILLSDVQIADLLRHREETGDFISLLELQSLDSFSEDLIQVLLPYMSVDGELNDYQRSIANMLQAGKNDLYLRWQYVLQEARAFTDDVNEDSRFQGDRNKIYLRYQHSYENTLSYGITAEKDAGEAFFKKPNQAGFDFYSAHFFLKDYRQNIKAIALGDYSLTLGQGLIAHTGFGYGKTGLVMNVKKSSRKLRPYRSVNEVGFLRGAAATVALSEQIEMTAFTSYRGKDGNALLLEDLTTGTDDQILGFTSILNSGFHRNQNEIQDKNAIRQLTTGANITYTGNRWRVGLNGTYDSFNTPLMRRILPYNIFYFNGQNNFNASIDYNANLRNFNFFGETAISKSGGMATLNGMLVGLDRKADLALVYRNYSPEYVALNANAFGETTGVRNESGLYLGLVLRPAQRWEWSSYIDFYEHPWLRSQADAPSRGYDWRSKLRYFKKRDFEAYIQLRFEAKEVNASMNTTRTDFLSTRELFQARFRLSKKVTPILELRSSFDIGYASFESSGTQLQGTVLLQDVVFKPLSSPWSFNARYAIFDTDGYAIRFYYFENALLNTFSVPAYYGKGSRFYLNARYKGIRNLMIEARYEQSHWRDRTIVGSSLTQTEGPLRSSVWMQLRYRF